MKLNWKVLRLALVGTVLAVGIGCGGLNASHSISPASFFLPGLGSVNPVSTNAPTLAAIQ